VISHIRQVLPGLFEEGSSVSVSYMNSNDLIQQALNNNHETRETLLQYDGLHILLKEEVDCQDLIRGVYRLVQAGRIHADREDSKHHMFIMESVSDSPDLMYLHLLPDR
jgi:hypothetical protein